MLETVGMGAVYDFRLLGPLEVDSAEGPVALRQGKQRILLAALLLSAKEVVSTQRLVDELWPGGPPPSAATVVHGHVSALRKLLGSDRLETRPPGYLLRAADEEIDRVRFERLLASARSEIDPRLRAERLRQALTLWRGSVLADVPCEGSLQTEIRRLEDLRLVVVEDWLEAELACGRHLQIVPELARLVADEPLRERPRAQLMLALYRSGRNSEALQVYADGRRLLVEEVGIEPGAPLKELERRILAQDPELALGPVEPKSLDAGVPGRREIAAGTRKRVTVLLAMVVEPVDADDDPESLAQALARAFELARPVLDGYAVRLQRSSDASLFAIFGIPELHEDDALRAARAGTELSGLLGIRVGIATGEVFVDSGGVVTGRPLAAASRLADVAAAGEIVIDVETLSLVRDAAVVERIALDEPAWRVRELLPGAAGVARRLDAALIGRERELEELERTLERAFRDAIPQLVTLFGPAGIGKTRLAGELMAHVPSEGQILVGRCQPYGHGITYWPLAEMVAELVPEGPRSGLLDLIAGDPGAETIVDRVLDVVGERAEVSTREEIFWSVRRLVEVVAEKRPLLLVFEDVHWAEPTMLDLIEHLADWVREGRLFLLCLARIELLDTRPTWSGGKVNARSVLLEPLSSEQSAQLLANQDGAGELGADARAEIVRVAGGNPFFVEELTRSARPRTGAARSLSPTISALLAARLDRLTPLERAAIECAAIQGAEFWREAVTDLMPTDSQPELGRAFDALVAKDLIRTARSPSTAREAFCFRHELVRQVAYDGATKSTRARLHERLADWLEAGDAAPDELLGYHLEQAHRYRSDLVHDDGNRLLGARAAGLLGSGGRLAFARGDVAAAVNLLERAAALTAPTDAGHADTRYALGAALVEAGDLSRAEAVLSEARAAAAGGELAVCALAKVELGFVAAMRLPDGYGLLRQAGEEALAVGEALEDDHVQARALYALAQVHQNDVHFAKAQAAHERGLPHARVAGDRRAEAASLYFLGACTFYGPTPAVEAVRTWEQHIEESRSSPMLQAAASAGLGPAYALRARFEEARAAISHAIDLYEQMGMALHGAGTTYGLAEVELLAGDPAAAEAAVRPGYDAFTEIGEKSFRSGGAVHLARAIFAQGRYDEVEHFVEVMRTEGGPQEELEWRAIRAKLLARSGAGDEALRLAHEAVELSRRGDGALHKPRFLTDLAEVQLLLGHTRNAIVAIEEALRLHELKQNRPGADHARGLLASVASPASA
jgi:DNA-binding SARP family transcriptional activator/tetratricopeptide (TPR) repeat protein